MEQSKIIDTLETYQGGSDNRSGRAGEVISLRVGLGRHKTQQRPKPVFFMAQDNAQQGVLLVGVSTRKKNSASWSNISRFNKKCESPSAGIYKRSIAMHINRGVT